MNVLTIEQMKELQALGCNVNKASRVYLVKDINNVIDEKTYSAWKEFTYDSETVPILKDVSAIAFILFISQLSIVSY